MIDPCSKDRSVLVGLTFRRIADGEQETRLVVDYTIGGGVCYRTIRGHLRIEFDPIAWDRWAKDAKVAEPVIRTLPSLSPPTINSVIPFKPVR